MRGPLPLCGRLVLGLVLALGLASSPAQSQQEGTPTLTSARAWCRILGQDTRNLFPALCRAQVHWFLGVDTSGSMTGLKLQTTKELIGFWLNQVAVEGDRLTVVAFDHRVQVSPDAAVPWQVGPPGERSQLREKVMSALRIPGQGSHGGTATQAARTRLLDLASQVPPSHLALVLVLGDRDDDDGQAPTAGSTVPARLQWKFASRQEPKADDPVWGQKAYTFVRDQKPFELLVLTSGSRDAAARAQGPLQPRRIPVLETGPVKTPPRPIDTWKTVRGIVPLLPLLPLVAAVGLFLKLNSSRAGFLFHREGSCQVTIPWRLRPPPPHDIKASKNEPGLALTPLRDDLGDPVVLRATLEAPWSWSPWKLHLEALPGFMFQEMANRTQETTLLPNHEHQLQLVDQRGPVTRGILEWKPDRGTQNALRGAILAAILAGLLLLGHPVMQQVLPPPPPVPAPLAPPDSEPLCQSTVLPRPGDPLWFAPGPVPSTPPFRATA